MSFTNSVVATGDDCIAVKAGFTSVDWGCDWPSARQRFENITCVHSHGLTVGSEMSSGVEDILFRNITVGVVYAAVRVKSARGRGGYIRNVAYQGIAADTVLDALWIDMNYAVVNACTPLPACVPTVENITVSGLEVARQVDQLPPPYLSKDRAGAAYTLVGLPESRLRGISVEGVRVRQFARAQECTHAELSVARDLQPPLRGNASSDCHTTISSRAGRAAHTVPSAERR